MQDAVFSQQKHNQNLNSTSWYLLFNVSTLNNKKLKKVLNTQTCNQEAIQQAQQLW